MSESNEPNLTHPLPPLSHSQHEIPPIVSSESSRHIEYPSRRGSSNRATDGNESDASLPSLQTVSDSSDDEPDDESESEWETDSIDSEDSQDDDAPPVFVPEDAPPGAAPSTTRTGVAYVVPGPQPSREFTLREYLGADMATDLGLGSLRDTMRAITESLAAIATPDDLQNLPNIFGPLTEVDDDPERAKTIMAKLETVPKDLIRRYEKLRRGVKEGKESWERDQDGCAICREPFCEEEGTDNLVVGGSRGPSPLRTSSSLKTGDPPEDPLRTLAFPCPGMHLFHAECLAPWLSRKTTCPSCRYDVDPNSLTLRLEQFSSRSNDESSIDYAGYDEVLFLPQGPQPTPRDEPSPRPMFDAYEMLLQSPSPFPVREALERLPAAVPPTTRDVEVSTSEQPVQGATLISGPAPARPARRQWSPPRGRDFRTWLERQERKKDGLDGDDVQDHFDDLQSSEDPDIRAPPPHRTLGAQDFHNVFQRLLDRVAQIPLRPPAPPTPPPPVPPPPLIPAIPPWEEREFPGPNANGFVGARRAAGAAPRPSPLRFQATVPEHGSESESEEEDDFHAHGVTFGDDASSMPGLGNPEDPDIQAFIQASRVREANENATSEREARRGADIDEQSDDEELPLLIPDTVGQYATTSSSVSPSPYIGRTDHDMLSRAPHLFSVIGERLTRLNGGETIPGPYETVLLGQAEASDGDDASSAALRRRDPENPSFSERGLIDPVDLHRMFASNVTSRRMGTPAQPDLSNMRHPSSLDDIDD